MYADDTVLFFANKDPKEIEKHLNADLENAAAYFRENELVINLKKEKTEVMLFGAAKRLKTTGDKIVLPWTEK